MSSVSTLRKKYFGDRAFYKMVLGISIPMMIQNAITNFVSLLDNIMVGQLGTEAVSSVAIVNQLMFVYNLCVFGGLSGAGIFTAQYFGSKNDKGIRRTFRYKLWVGFLVTVAAFALLGIGGDFFIGSYLQEGDAAQLAATLHLGRQYLLVMLVGLPAFMLTQVYASTLRECGETVAPMRAGIVAVLVNLVFNYLLIYGHFGFPRLGVVGAAIATVLSRYVELAVILVWTHAKKERAPYLANVYHTLRVPLAPAKEYTIKGLPLMANEALWSIGMAMLMQCYSVRGLDVVAGFNISNTICNLFNVVFMTLGGSVSIVVGQMLGAGDLQKAKQYDTWLIVFTMMCGTGMAVLVAVGAPYFPLLYKVSAESRAMATQFILAAALYMPMISFLHSTYFTIRTGGKTIITFFFDCGFTWCVNLPIAWLLSRYTALPALEMYLIVEGSNFIKCVIGYVLVKKNIWLQNMVEGHD